jgi:shikimate kinase
MINQPYPDIRQFPKKIFLIGMPGGGKTYWGAALAQGYELKFFDLDAFISAEEKAGIPALFARYGEAGFREKENKNLKKIINISGGGIVACGGGTPFFYDNMALMKKAGIVIYLQADVETLVRNMQQSNETRPLLKGRDDVAAYLKDLLITRKEVYEQAHIILPVKDVSLATFGEIILSCINRH